MTISLECTTYMVGFHEDAYWPKLMSLFTAGSEHLLRLEKRIFGQKKMCMSGEYVRLMVVLRDVPKK